MLRSGWLILLAAGMLTGAVRAAGLSPLADAMAMAYLFFATLAFGRRRAPPEPHSVPVRREPVAPDRRR
jgi:hypothetical protein